MEAVQGCTKNVVFHTELLCEACGMKKTLGSSYDVVANYTFYLAREINIVIIMFLLWLIEGGSGVPHGTKPETCRRCKGAGIVSITPI